MYRGLKASLESSFAEKHTTLDATYFKARRSKALCWVRRLTQKQEYGLSDCADCPGDRGDSTHTNTLGQDRRGRQPSPPGFEPRSLNSLTPLFPITSFYTSNALRVSGTLASSALF